MFLSWWLRKLGVDRSPADRTRPAAARLGVESLDDRVVPNASFFGSGFGSSGPATHLLVITPHTATAGASSPVAVVALDASNHVATGYTGTVHFTDTDAGATLPADYTFTAADHGFHVFKETPAAAGTDTITATDTSNSSVTGSATLTVNTAPVATHFAVITRQPAYAGDPLQVAVVALDASNHVVRNYTGTVQLTSTNSADALPAGYTFTASDHGVHVFTVTTGAAGPDTITATDTANSSLTGSVSVTVNPAQVATHFAVLVRRSAQAGEPTRLVVVALDASNQIVRNYTGTVHLSSSDTKATLPADYTFTASDRGVHAFGVTLATTGTQTVTATDTTSSGLTGTATVHVRPAPSGTGHFAGLLHRR